MNDEFNNNNESIKKAIIVSVNTGNDELFSYQLEELRNLCITSNINVIFEIVQNLSNVVNSTYVGSGKLQEIKQISSSMNADIIIFNDELSPIQLKNIDECLDDFEVLDRTMVILEIFGNRARTREAYLQVEIARFRYMLPRLIGKRQYLSRIGGGGGGNSGARRGSGETKLELDRRHIERQLTKLKEELAIITKNRATTRKLRQETSIPVVAFVGYTNAGKSTTINTLLKKLNNEEKQVFACNMLFATLETSTRKVKLANNHDFLLTDTVGFVSKLPHHLVQSFKSTLEEIKEANLIVHIIDSSSPFYEMQIATTEKVLLDLDVKDIPTIYAYNKVDLVKNISLLNVKDNSILISSVNETGYQELINTIDTILYNNIRLCTMLLPFDKTNIFNFFKENAEIVETEYLFNGIKIVVKLPIKLYNKYQEYTI